MPSYYTPMIYSLDFTMGVNGQSGHMLFEIIRIKISSFEVEKS